MRTRRVVVAVVVGMLGACGGSGLDESTTDGVGAVESSTTTLSSAAGVDTTSAARSTSEPSPTTSIGAGDATQETTVTTRNNDQREDEAKETPRSSAPPTTAQSAGAEMDPGLEPIVEMASSDLASRLGIDLAAVVVLSAENVVWPDASLGCPMPGMVYAQVTADGARIVLAAGGTEYHYHTGGNQYEPFLCETPAET